MIWKLYRMIALLSCQHVLSACFGRYASWQIDTQVEDIDQLIRLINCINQYQNLHPNFAKDQYGSVEGFVRTHLSEQDWIVLVQILEPSLRQVQPENLL